MKKLMYVLLGSGLTSGLYIFYKKFIRKDCKDVNDIYEQEVTLLEKNFEQITLDYVSGTIDKETYDNKINDLKNKISKVKQDILNDSNLQEK